MALKLVGALVLALAATSAAAREAGPYEVFYRAAVNESLCRLLPGHPMKFAVPPSLGRWKTKDRLEVSCDDKRLRDAPEVGLKFWLDADVPSQTFDFRWGQDVAAKNASARGQFQNDPGLCQKVAKLIEQAAIGAPKHTTLHLINSKLTVECLPDARWGTSLNLRLVLNQPEPPLTPEQQLKILRAPR